MKKILFIFTVQFFVVFVFAQTKNASIAIIPEPVSIVTNTGNFVLPSSVTIDAGTNKELIAVAEQLSKQLSVPTGSKVSVNDKMQKSNSTISLKLNSSPDNTIGNEGYKLQVTSQNITISANKPAGVFYGLQTLLQLFPKEIESKTPVKNSKWIVPCVTVTDYPRFGWRGLMFDVARHFFTKQEVKDFIDEMVKYKYNLLHWHLTDDEGWRIEIKSLPKLTSVGAWNVKRVGYFGTFKTPDANEPRDYGGFYTQNDIKEVIEYAKKRYVNILPEIDVPGHSLAAIAAYPELSCSNGVENHGVGSGEEIKDWNTHTALVDDNLCPANENVYVFLDKVLTEVAQLFPFEYIHMGGDETFKTFWERSDAVKALMQKEGLKNMEEVQSYFSKRIEKIVESKGKKFMGWDEILEGGLAPNAAVMSWQGIKGGIKAAEMKHEVVMSPTTFVYLDYMQSDSMVEPYVYATLRLNTTYSFEPVPDGVDEKYIKGGQGNLWTEQVYNTRHMQYMLWPRSLAIAECVWSPKAKKNWDNFTRKVESTFGRMDAAQVKYSRAMFDPVFTATKDGSVSDSLKIELSTEVNGLDIYYTFDNSHPDNFYPKYTSPLTVPKQAVMLKVITYRDGKPIGRQIDMPVNVLRRRAGLKN
jgi:hexosaminidase